MWGTRAGAEAVATVTEVAEAFVADAAALDPVGATRQGIAGHESEMTDFSPDGVAARADLARRARRRVVIDIGLHLELRIPTTEPLWPGERWTPARAVDLLMARASQPHSFVVSEVDRYLGMPGQAISYKVGERVWLAGREASRRRQGAAFDLRTFHARALELGPMGLADLARHLEHC
ncbi:MAG: DUF885 family protein [Acidimicrobiales bacterium]